MHTTHRSDEIRTYEVYKQATKQFRNDYVGVGAPSPWPVMDKVYSVTGVFVEQETVAISFDKQKKGAVFRGRVCKSGTTGMDCIVDSGASSEGIYYTDFSSEKLFFRAQI